jgi:hypothetical protein
MKLKFLLILVLTLCLRITQAQNVVDIIVNSPDLSKGAPLQGIHAEKEESVLLASLY